MRWARIEELESLIGRIAKAVPVGVSFAGDLQFREVASAVQEALTAAGEKQEHFAPQDGATSALGFEYVEFDEGATFGDVRFRMQRAEAEAEPYTLKLQAERTPAGMRLVLHYDASRLRRETVERWSGHFLTLLEAALERPSEKVSRRAAVAGARARAVVSGLEPDASAVSARSRHARVDSRSKRNGRRSGRLCDRATRF